MTGLSRRNDRIKISPFVEMTGLSRRNDRIKISPYVEMTGLRFLLTSK
jgi:hypothetical protein